MPCCAHCASPVTMLRPTHHSWDVQSTEQTQGCADRAATGKGPPRVFITCEAGNHSMLCLGRAKSARAALVWHQKRRETSQEGCCGRSGTRRQIAASPSEVTKLKETRVSQQTWRKVPPPPEKHSLMETRTENDSGCVQAHSRSQLLFSPPKGTRSTAVSGDAEKEKAGQQLLPPQVPFAAWRAVGGGEESGSFMCCLL